MGALSKAPRLFVFIIGQLRTADYTFPNFRANIIDWPDTSILMQCPEADKEVAAKTYRSAFTDAWDPSPILPPCVRYAWPLWGNTGREARRVKPSFYFQLVRQFRAASVFAHQIDLERDWILKWRPDLMLFGPLDWRALAAKQEAVWLPQHDNHGGFNDQCALGPATLMLPYLRRLERLHDYLAAGGRIHSETFLKWSMAHVPVKRTPLPYCIHRGGHLNPVKFACRYGDEPDVALIEVLRTSGVSVELDEASTDPVSISRKWIGQIWQKTVARTLCPESLAAYATSRS